MNRVDNPKSLLYALGALLLAVLLVVLVEPRLKLSGLTNLDLINEGISDLYLQMDPSVPGRCSVTNRRASTFRRSDDPAARESWDFKRGAGQSGTGNLEHWLLQSRSKKTFLLVPVDAVDDWTYPYLYQFVRKIEEQVGLPPVEWVQLFVNRIYQGLFLRVQLPHDPRRRDGGTGYQREMLTSRGPTMVCLDTRFSGPCTAYPTAIANTQFPTLAPAAGLLQWLVMESPLDEVLLVLQPFEPYEMTYLPLPISLEEEYAQISGSSLTPFMDERFKEWGQSSSPAPFRLESLLSPREFEQFHEEWEEYRTGFTAALTAHCEYHQCVDGMTIELEQRLELPVR